MNNIDAFELRRLVAEVKPMPVYRIASPWSKQIACPICYELKIGSMVLHRQCMRLICARCMSSCLDTTSNCGFCREPLWDNEINESFIFSPTPNDNWLLDNLMFNCDKCEQDLTYSQACTHPNNCEADIGPRGKRFKPPSYIYDWNNVEVTRRQTISNPRVGPPETRKERLLIYHYNGQQLDSKMINARWDIARVKLQIARLTEGEANKIRLFSVTHEELDNDKLVGDIAKNQGAFHITALTDLNGVERLNESTAVISFHAVGPRPDVARPKSDRARGRAPI